MPFGEYTDFADCVAKNASKSNPQAFCAAVHKRITGKWPSELETLANSFALAKMLKGVSIISPGSYTAAVGGDVTFDEALFTKLISNFHFGVPIPLKLGHTSDEFNSIVAEALGVPVEVIIGEGSANKGAAKLGEVVRLEIDGDLKADVIFANDKVGDLFTNGFFDTFSVEMAENFRWGPDKTLGEALTGLSALGAQIPAVIDLPRVEQEHLLENISPNTKVILCSLSLEGNMPDPEDNKKPEDDEDMKAQAADDEDDEDDDDKVAAQMDEDEDDKERKNMELSKVLGKALSIPADEVTPEKIITAVGELVNAQDSNVKQFETYDTRLANLQGKIRHFEYVKETSLLTAVPGTPDEIASKLVEVEQKAGTETAQLLLESFQNQQKLSEDNTKALLNKNTGTKTELKDTQEYPFEVAVKELATAQGISLEKANVQYALAHPKEFSAYRSEKLLAMDALGI